MINMNLEKTRKTLWKFVAHPVIFIPIIILIFSFALVIKNADFEITSIGKYFSESVSQFSYHEGLLMLGCIAVISIISLASRLFFNIVLIIIALTFVFKLAPIEELETSIREYKISQAVNE